MKRLITVLLVVLVLALATGTALAVNGPKVGDGPTATSKWRVS